MKANKNNNEGKESKDLLKNPEENPAKLDAKLAHLDRLRQREDSNDLGVKETSFFTGWLAPIILIASLAGMLHVGIRFWDASMSADIRSFPELFLLQEADHVADAIGGMAEVMVALLGLVITVVAIVVQLAAQRYTPKLVELFIADKINLAYFVLMVVTSMYSVLMIYSVRSGFLPFWGALSLVGLSMLVMTMLLPYFSHVFRFLTPANILSNLRYNASRSMRRVRIWGSSSRHKENVANSMEQISDIALSAVSQTDRNVALLSLHSLRDVMVDHMLTKKRMPSKWFAPKKNHFPAISRDFFEEIEGGRNWVELRGFMDMDLLFKTAVQQMPDAVSSIANNTRIMGHYACYLDDHQVLNDAVQFFNTFLRHSLNARNPKAIYNLLYQYRLLAEDVLEFDEELAKKIVFYFKFYGQAAQTYNIPLILVTVCFDMVAILKRAYLLKSPSLDQMLNLFLEVDDSPATRSNEFELRSVRKAQINFASFMLAHQEYALLQRIVEDIIEEPLDRMQAIHKEMMGVTSRKFWEITDRGVDFFYLEEKEKELVEQLFYEYIIPACKKTG